MAQRITTTITSDLSDADGAETVTFGLHGAQYEIDLTPDEQKDLDKALEPFLNAARRAGGSTRRASRPASGATSNGNGVDAKAVRAWAAENNIEVSPRGRINGKVLEQFRAAGN